MQKFNSLNDVKRHAESLMNKRFTINVRGYHTIVSARELGYSFEFDGAKRRFGVCRYTRKVIGLSKPLAELNLNDFWRINNTLLHEIAHAIAYSINRVEGKGHGWLWRQVALAIGCDGERCYDGGSVNKPTSKYTLVCGTCNKKTPMHRKPKRSYACGDCCNGSYNEKYKLIIKQNY